MRTTKDHQKGNHDLGTNWVLRLKFLIVSLLSIFLYANNPLMAQSKKTLESLLNTKGELYLESRPIISSSGSKIYFTRSHFPGPDQEQRQDIWLVDFGQDGYFPLVQAFSKTANRFHQNTLVSISNDDKEMIVVNNKFAKAPLLRLKLKNGKWKNAGEIQIRNFYTLSAVRDFHYSFNEEVILMSLQQNDLEHGQDLFISFPGEDGKWSKPAKLSASINSDGDETAPFLAADGRSLFYCSTKSGGTGKSDIYFTYRLDDSWSSWSTPVNLGNQINSQENESYVSVSPDFKLVYYDSYSPLDKDKTIYQSPLPDHIQEEIARQKELFDDNPTAVEPPVLPESIIAYQSRLKHKISRHISASGLFTQMYQYQSSLSNTKYTGPVSISAKSDGQALTMVNTPIMLNFWNNNEIILCPEFQIGNGIGNGAGMGAYPNAIYAVPQTTPYLSRIQMRHYFEFKNGKRLQKYNVTLGRYVIQDMFDKNPYASDPQKDFLNFSHTMLLSWDAATTAYGYTYGLAQSFIYDKSIINVSLNTVPGEAGGLKPDWDITKGHSINLQYVYQFDFMGKPGKARILGYYNRYKGGDFQKYYMDSEGVAVFDSTARYTTKMGGAVDISYNVSKNIGLFIRYSGDDGRHEDFGYTQADGSLHGGALLAMHAIQRPGDRLGFSSSYNILSSKQQQYLKNGGTGFMVGDGNLQYAPEIALETFYSINFLNNFFLAFNYQYVMNVGYNADRGNAHFLAARLSIDL